jgi:low affinity Fe/Cu permease
MSRKNNSPHPHANAWFGEFAKHTSNLMGRPIAFAAAVLLIVGWAVCGPLFGFSDTWQLVINTGTTIITFLMVFLIQNTQNRDTHALQIKLDELIRAVEGARNVVLDVEELDEEELEEIRHDYEKLAEAEREDKAGPPEQPQRRKKSRRKPTRRRR